MNQVSIGMMTAGVDDSELSSMALAINVVDILIEGTEMTLREFEEA